MIWGIFQHCCWLLQKEETCSFSAGFYYRKKPRLQQDRGRRLRAERGRSCSSLFPHSLHSTKLFSDPDFVSWTITGKQKHGEFVHTSVGDSKFLLLILNIIDRVETPALYSIIFASEREKMDALRAPENESLLSSSSSPARWDPFRRPLDSIQPWHFSLLAAVMLVVTSLSLAENLAVILVTSKFKQLRQPVNYVIVNLSVADFLVSLTGGTISFLTNLKGYFYLGYWACVLEGFAVTFFGKLDFVCSCMFFSLTSSSVLY